jgi:hypothetical protein
LRLSTSRNPQLRQNGQHRNQRRSHGLSASPAPSILLSAFGRVRPDMPSGHPDTGLKNGKSGSDVSVTLPDQCSSAR